jgi:hypothetical protein
MSTKQVDPAEVFSNSKKPDDLSDAIAHCDTQLKRLGLSKRSPAIVLWLDINGYAGQWERLDLPGFRDLYRFLLRCEP